MPDHAEFIESLEGIAGPKNVLTDDAKTRRFTKGYRYGAGAVLAVVRPRSLVDLWRVISFCVARDKIIIMQAANTGLTGGSTPDGDSYDRDVVMINTLLLDKVHLLGDGQQVLCQPGATLYRLEDMLRPLGREPHSVIGSSCIGASVVGGVCNNSGGALVQRGPAYTELALYAHVTPAGQLELINDLGIALGSNPEEILQRLDDGAFTDQDIQWQGTASDREYASHIRAVDAETPARFNADPRRLHTASGCAGKLAVFAVRLDTFKSAGPRRMFYIGTNETSDLSNIRRDILTGFEALPISAEYMHAEAYDIAEKYGKDIFLAIHYLGTRFLPVIYNLKSRVDAFFEKIGRTGFSDRLLQGLSKCFPAHLPPRIKAYRKTYAHYLMLDITAVDAEKMHSYLSGYFAGRDTGAFFECTAVEAKKAQLHRFVAAGAGVRYRVLHADVVEDILALDIALRRNDPAWFETLPHDIAQDVVAKLYYGHFFCHVFHQDYLIRKGADVSAVKSRMLATLDARRAEYPAEHNVGHVYKAKDNLARFYRDLDPCNVFNPGIGKTAKKKDWQEL